MPPTLAPTTVLPIFPFSVYSTNELIKSDNVHLQYHVYYSLDKHHEKKCHNQKAVVPLS